MGDQTWHGMNGNYLYITKNEQQFIRICYSFLGEKGMINIVGRK